MSEALFHESFARYPSMTVNGRDDKAWAKRLVWRYRQKDRDLLHVQVQFAHEALGLDPKDGTEQ